MLHNYFKFGKFKNFLNTTLAIAWLAINQLKLCKLQIYHSSILYR